MKTFKRLKFTSPEEKAHYEETQRKIKNTVLFMNRFERFTFTSEYNAQKHSDKKEGEVIASHKDIKSTCKEMAGGKKHKFMLIHLDPEKIRNKFKYTLSDFIRDGIILLSEDGEEEGFLRDSEPENKVPENKFRKEVATFNIDEVGNEITKNPIDKIIEDKVEEVILKEAGKPFVYIEDLKEAKKEYKRILGKNAYHAWDLDTINEKIKNG